MSNKPFVYQDPFPLKKDDTEYYLLSRDYVSVAEFAGQQVLKVEPQALTLLAQHAFHDASFMPDVELQDGEMRGWGRIATPTCYSYAA